MEPERDKDIQRTTVYLPRWLHKAIKLEAVNSERSITDVVVEVFAPRYPELAPKAGDQAEPQLAAA